MNRDDAQLTLLFVCASVLIVAAISVAAAIVAPVTFALFIVAVVWPLQSALQRRIPKLLALVLTVAATLAVIAVLVFLLVWGIGLVVQWLANNAARLQTLYAQAADWLDGHGVSIKSLMIEQYDPGWIIGAVREIGGRGYRLIAFVVIAFAFTVLGLLEIDALRHNVRQLGNPQLTISLMTAAADIAAKFQKYMLVRSTMSVLTGIVVWSFALFAGIELATAWGVIAFVFNYIPFIGPLFATVFPTVFALVQSGSWELALMVFAGLNLIQFVIGSYLEPRIAGAALSMSPFMVLLAVFFWGFLWGVPGAFIGVPIMIAILTLCEEHDATRWIAVLMSGRDRKRI